MRRFLFITVVSTIMLAPVLVLAAPSSPLSEPTGVMSQRLLPDCGADCSWVHLVQLASNILNFLVYLSIIAAAIMFAYAGFLYMSDGGSMDKVKKAHGIFTAVVVGIIIVLVAWLSVDTLMKSLTGKGVKEWSKNQQSSISEPLRRAV